MDDLGDTVCNKIRAAIKAKLRELDISVVDNELPDYVMVMVANKRSRLEMQAELSLFLGSRTEEFTSWLHQVLYKLQQVTVTILDPYQLAVPASNRLASTVVEVNKSGQSASSSFKMTSSGSKTGTKRKTSTRESDDEIERGGKRHKLAEARKSNPECDSKVMKHSLSSSSEKNIEKNVDNVKHKLCDLNVSSSETTLKSQQMQEHLISEGSPELLSQNKQKIVFYPSDDDEDFINIKADAEAEALLQAELPKEALEPIMCVPESLLPEVNTSNDVYKKAASTDKVIEVAKVFDKKGKHREAKDKSHSKRHKKHSKKRERSSSKRHLKGTDKNNKEALLKHSNRKCSEAEITDIQRKKLGAKDCSILPEKQTEPSVIMISPEKERIPGTFTVVGDKRIVVNPADLKDADPGPLNIELDSVHKRRYGDEGRHHGNYFDVSSHSSAEKMGTDFSHGTSSKFPEKSLQLEEIKKKMSHSEKRLIPKNTDGARDGSHLPVKLDSSIKSVKITTETKIKGSSFRPKYEDSSKSRTRKRPSLSCLTEEHSRHGERGKSSINTPTDHMSSVGKKPSILERLGHRESFSKKGHLVRHQEHGSQGSFVKRTSAEELQQDQNGGVSSVIRVKPRPRVAPAMQANCKLIIKAMAEATKSVTAQAATGRIKFTPQTEIVETPHHHHHDRVSIVLPRGRLMSLQQESKDRGEGDPALERLVVPVEIEASRSISSVNLQQKIVIQVSSELNTKAPGAYQHTVKKEKSFTTRSNKQPAGEIEHTEMKVDNAVEECTKKTLKREESGSSFRSVVGHLKTMAPNDRSKSPQFLVTLDGIKPRTIRPAEYGEDEPKSTCPSQSAPESKVEIAIERKTVCKFWPNCHLGKKCRYNHPTEKCGLISKVKRPENLQALCKFDKLCTREVCQFRHTASSSNTSVLSHWKSFKELCKFHPKCYNAMCKFRHPKVCHYGRYCAKEGCQFFHIELTTKEKFKWSHKVEM